jgi:hypothetical protein
MSVRYSNPELIADKVFATVPVTMDKDLYRIYDRGWKLPETKRANKAEAREYTFDVSTASYVLERHALKDYISQDDIDNYDIADLRADTTIELKDALARVKEKKVADLFVKANWSLQVSLASGAEWTANTTTSNPIPIVDTAATTILNNSGFKPNYGIMPRATVVAVKNHISVLDRTKYTSKDMSIEIMKGLFDLGEILEGIGSYDTAARGLAASVTPFWDDFMFVGYKPANPGPRVPASGYIFRKMTPPVYRYEVPERRCEAIEVEEKYVAKIVASLTGYLIGNTQ